VTTAPMDGGREWVGEQVADPLVERTWLVRLCTRFTGDVDVAEDLAQETLLEAWQHAHELRAPEARTAWLAGIARNRCLRWARRRRRDIARLIHVDGEPDALVTPAVRELADDVDLELELERDELATLLDRALALLPVETRQALVQRYIEALPQAEVAARLGMSEGAVAVRLHRGKLALRRALAGDLALIDPDSIPAQTWQETRIWCPLCGRRRLMGYLGDTGSDLLLRCPGCCPQRDDCLTSMHLTGLFSGVKGYKPALTRLLRWLHDRYTPHLTSGVVPCLGCGQPTSLSTVTPAAPRWLRDARGISHHCTACDSGSWDMLEGLVLALPQGQRFWHEHLRIQALPQREVEAAGRAALVAGFESVSAAARFEVVVARDTYAVISIH
jgi:RNA polymerase sigma factor (sigma-70 family)